MKYTNITKLNKNRSLITNDNKTKTNESKTIYTIGVPH